MAWQKLDKNPLELGRFDDQGNQIEVEYFFTISITVDSGTRGTGFLVLAKGSYGSCRG